MALERIAAIVVLIVSLPMLSRFTRMVITADNFLSWQVAVWFAAASLVVALAWLVTRRVQPMWLRVFFRAAVVALCFAPLPHLVMFMEEGAKAGVLVVTPLWYALFRSVAEGALLGVGVVVILWLVFTYFLWVAGM